MLRSPDGTPLWSGKPNDKENEKLRGAKLNEIAQDLNDDELSDEQKVLRYGSHLEWFLEQTRMLLGAQQKAQSEGVFDVSIHTVGIANGLILASAIFLGEQGDPPTRKIPNKLRHRSDELLAEKVKGFIITLITQLEAVICIEDNKPKGYGEYDVQEAYARWHNDTVEHLNNCPVSFPELQAAINRIGEFHRKNHNDE